jgi:DNA mismatch repair ATPase MutS
MSNNLYQELGLIMLTKLRKKNFAILDRGASKENISYIWNKEDQNKIKNDLFEKKTWYIDGQFIRKGYEYPNKSLDDLWNKKNEEIHNLKSRCFQEMGYNKYELERDDGYRFMQWVDMTDEEAIEQESYLFGAGILY